MYQAEINSRLATVFGRSGEAIKQRRLRFVSYKVKIAQLKSLEVPLLESADDEQMLDSTVFATDGVGPNPPISAKEILTLHLQSLRSDIMACRDAVTTSLLVLIDKTLQGRDIDDDELLRWLRIATGERVSVVLPSVRTETMTPVEVLNRRQRKRHQYSILQKLIRKCRCAKVLSDPDVHQIRANPSDILEHFEEVLLSPSTVGASSVSSSSDVLKAIWEPFTVEEITQNEIDKNTGLDGVRSFKWSKVSPELRIIFYSIMMIRGRFPKLLSKGRTVIISKKVLEQPLNSLDSYIGFRIDDNNKINALLFADDAILIASTGKGLQVNVNKFSDSLRLCGMSLNPNKCEVLSLSRQVGRKRLKFLRTPLSPLMMS